MNFIKKYMKDAIIYILMIAIFILLAYTFYDGCKREDILDKTACFIGSIVTILFGVIGVFEFAYDNGLTLLVPNSFIKSKERRYYARSKNYIEEYFTKETNYLSKYSNNRIEFFLNKLGICHNELDEIRMEILRIKLMPLRDCEDAKKKLLEIIKKNDVIVSQQEHETSDLVYKNVKFYINILNCMFVSDYSNELSDCLVCLIKKELDSKLLDVTKIVIPYNGNVLLGLEVAKKLGLSVVKIVEKPRVYNSQHWDGNFDKTKDEHVIMVHDVFVTGEQIVNSLKEVPKFCKVEGVFSLIDRNEEDCKDSNRINNINKIKRTCKIYSLIRLTDKDIEEGLKNDK